METIDRLHPIVLGPSDIEGAMALVAEAGWNQVPADWRLMGVPGGAVGLRAEDGTLVATALALPYPPDFGWISMVLVTGAYRRQGLATALLRDRIEWLRERNLVPILDATEFGAAVYARIGFEAKERFTRWEGQGGGSGSFSDFVRPAGPEDHAWILALDTAVAGADRSILIGDLLDRPGSRCWVSRSGEAGFAIARTGRRATQVGPMVAADEAMAVDLLGAALAGVEGPVFLDAVDARSVLADFIRAKGLVRQRGFVRMSLGKTFDFDGNGRAMVIAGPEYG